MKYKAPEGCEGVTLYDVWYPCDADGVVEVPNIATDLEAKGFTVYVEPTAKKSKKDSE